MKKRTKIFETILCIFLIIYNIIKLCNSEEKYYYILLHNIKFPVLRHGYKKSYE